MAAGPCRRCGLRPRRMSRGRLEPLCQECSREAIDKVAGELAAEMAQGGGARVRGMGPPSGARPAGRAPERVAPMARADARPLGREPQHAGRGTRPRRISEELLGEARRLYRLGLSLRAVAETLVDETGYANARSAEAALRFHFKRRGWPLRGRAQEGRTRRGAVRDDQGRAA